MHPGPQKGFLPQSSLTLILVVASEMRSTMMFKIKNKLERNAQQLGTEALIK